MRVTRNGAHCNSPKFGIRRQWCWPTPLCPSKKFDLLVTGTGIDSGNLLQELIFSHIVTHKTV